jgi:hypothetical protein
MKPENYAERTIEVDGWQVRLICYELGGQYHCTADNVSPGANLARVVAETKEAAESQALAIATEKLSRTRRHAV